MLGLSLSIQQVRIMKHKGNRKIYLARGIQEGPEKVTVDRGEAKGNSQLFPGPTESLEPDGFFCWPRDQSLFVFTISL